MKQYQYITYTLSLCLLGACQSQNSAKNTTIFEGDFANSPIELGITMLDDSTISGYSKHQGVHAKLTGIRRASERGYTYDMTEMGTGDYIGSYNCELDTTVNMLFGSWQQKKKTNIKEKTAVIFTLTKK